MAAWTPELELAFLPKANQSAPPRFESRLFPSSCASPPSLSLPLSSFFQEKKENTSPMQISIGRSFPVWINYPSPSNRLSQQLYREILKPREERPLKLFPPGFAYSPRPWGPRLLSWVIQNAWHKGQERTERKITGENLNSFWKRRARLRSLLWRQSS